MYAKVLTTPTTSSGLPDLYGTGCVKAPDFPKSISTCWGAPNTYPIYNTAYGGAYPICTSSGIKNAANMIRIGIIKGHCNLPCEKNFINIDLAPTTAFK